MKSFTVITDYLEHDGGTKFYECVLITEVGSESMLIKRFGSISAKMGGGQIRFYSGLAREADYQRQIILRAKCSNRPGKGQYLVASRPKFGLHEQHLGRAAPIDLYQALQRHYSGKTLESILTFFSLDVPDSDAPLNGSGALPDTESMVPEVRSNTWGSW